jgi:ABC-type Fe3+/spermidine/putrescine transport system ATPase subunit
MIELNGVGKTFEGGVAAVTGVTLAIAEGELVSLLGPSGCGKTTTLRMVAGFERPSAGTISIAGADVTHVPVERRGLSMVFQNYALFPHLTVFENVAFGLRLRGVASSEVATRVAEGLDRVGLSSLGGRLPKALSGGQQQRVSLARALVVNPSVLLLDEPLSNLDLKLREQLRDDIRVLQKSLGITAIYVTHDQGEAMAISDRIAVMRSGSIEQIGPPREIYERPRTAYVAGFIGQCNLVPGDLDVSARSFRTRGGHVIGVADAGLQGAAKPVRLAIRPEAIRLLGEGSAGLPGRVIEATYLGDRAQLTIALDPVQEGAPETLVVAWRVSRAERIPAAGEAVRLGLPPADCIPVLDTAA